MAIPMRAKFRIESVNHSRYSATDPGNEVLKFRAVSKSTAYPEDGSDEDNTYAKFSPSGTLELTVANPALIGKFNPGEVYYLDFTPVSPEKN